MPAPLAEAPYASQVGEVPAPVKMSQIVKVDRRGDRASARSFFLQIMAASPIWFEEARRNLAFLDGLEADGGGRPRSP